MRNKNVSRKAIIEEVVEAEEVSLKKVILFCFNSLESQS
jgi:hypothetical protein